MTTPHRSAPAPSGQAPSEEPRRARLLDAALTVFGRFGFRKTSMDEVARAAGISRQGLYLHYPTKEALFCAVVDHALGAAAEDAEQALGKAPWRTALVGALDAWVGRFVSRIAPDVTDHGAIRPRRRAREGLRGRSPRAPRAAPPRVGPRPTTLRRALGAGPPNTSTPPPAARRPARGRATRSSRGSGWPPARSASRSCRSRTVRADGAWWPPAPLVA